MTLSFLITTAVRKLRRNKIRFVIGDPHFDGPYKTGALSPISSMSFPARAGGAVRNLFSVFSGRL